MSNHSLPSAGGGLFTVLSAIIAYLSHPIPALQNSASILALIVGSITLINIIRKWNK